MDFDAVAFHAAEPGHLAFGKLMDGVAQGNLHVLVGEFSQDVLRYKLVLKAVLDKVLRRDRFQQAADFLHQTFLQALFQPPVDARHTLFA